MSKYDFTDPNVRRAAGLSNAQLEKGGMSREDIAALRKEQAAAAPDRDGEPVPEQNVVSPLEQQREVVRLAMGGKPATKADRNAGDTESKAPKAGG